MEHTTFCKGSLARLSADDFSIDDVATSIYPADGSPDMAPVRIFADGNCLFNAASLVDVGSQDSISGLL